MMLNIIGMAMGLPITWALLVHYGMLGAVVASLLSGALSTVVSLIFLKKRYDVGVEASRVVKYWLPSLVSSAPAYIAMRTVGDPWLALGVGLAMYSASLVALTVATTSTEDLLDLADISRGVKHVGPLISRALSVVVKVKAAL
jgi:O-antigen/teichoic acid export membrane protein